MRLVIVQHSEDSSKWTAVIGQYPNEQRCIITADSMENAITEAKNWCAYRKIEYTSLLAESNQGGYTGIKSK